MSSIKKNFAYSSFLTVSNYIINLLLFPYCARILGVEKLGAINFTQNIVQYFLFISMMGITHIGVREIAKQTTKADLSSCYSSMLVLNLIYTSLSLFIYIPAIFVVPKFVESQTLFLLGSLQIIFSQFTVEWFFRGIEDFRFITLRNIIIKILYVSAVFTFIKSPADYKLYYLFTVGMTILTACINFVYAHKIVKFSWKGVNICKYLKSSLSLGAYSILTSMYTTFNVAFLGFVWNDIQVGYYTTALKLYTIILGFYSAFTGIMLPRMTALINKGNNFYFQSYIEKSYNLLLTICLPVAVFLYMLAPEIIILLAGEEFTPAIPMSRIVVPMLIVVGLAQILSFQVLIPKGYDKATLMASAIGAIVGLISNIILTRKFAAIGTCVTVVITEVCVTVYYIYITITKKLVSINYGLLIKHLLFTLPYALFCIVSRKICSDSVIFTLLMALSISILYFLFSQIFILKNSIVLNSMDLIKQKLH